MLELSDTLSLELWHGTPSVSPVMGTYECIDVEVVVSMFTSWLLWRPVVLRVIESIELIKSTKYI